MEINQIDQIMPAARAPARCVRLVACSGGGSAGPRPAIKQRGRGLLRRWRVASSPCITIGRQYSSRRCVRRRTGARGRPAPVPHRRYGGPSRQRGSGRRWPGARASSPHQLVTSVTCGACHAAACRPWISAPACSAPLAGRPIYASSAYSYHAWCC